MIVRDLNLTDYRSAWDLQHKLVVDVKNGDEEYLLLTEHYHVYTLGKHGNQNNLLNLPQDSECIRIERGGDITYHGPGQLVVYPIINLYKHHIGVKDYVYILEQTVIDTIADFGIKGERVDGATGVWVDAHTSLERKICAIGVKISHGVTMHGFALNVNTDLSRFNAINPCGFVDKGVTSIQRERIHDIDMQLVKDIISHNLISLLNERRK